MWRSLVAHLTGGQGVVGSNPAIPTEMSQVRGPFCYGGAALLHGGIAVLTRGPLEEAT